MYQALLETVRDRMKSYGEGSQPPCSPSELEKLRNRAVHELGHAVPDVYAAFLALANGLDWNGLVVYASERTPIVGHTDRFIEGYVEANLDYRGFDPLSNYLIFADDGVVFYTYHISLARYEVILRVGLSVLESFGSFDELLVSAFKGHL
jgi:hypothetical protein